MKILHTADWHIGKKLKGIDRIQEYEDVLEEIINIAITESVDCIIISGDIFDSYTPSTDAEKLFWNIIVKIRKNNIELILLAGNHDSPKKIEAMQPSLEKHGVQVYARFDDNDLAKNIATIEKNNEKLQIAVIPWINESFLTKNLETFLETSKQEQGKQYGIILETIYRDIIELLDKDAIHILATHTLINEALIQEANQEKDISERRITLDKVTYGISSSQLPKQINYIALGHIHQPQEIIHNAPTHYAGSVLQLSFAEREQEKYVYIADCSINRATNVDRKILQQGIKLKQLESTYQDIIIEGKKYPNHYLKIIITDETPPKDFRSSIESILPNAIDVRLNNQSIQKIKNKNINSKQLTEKELYQEYLKKTGASKDLMNKKINLFNELFEKVETNET